GLSQRMLPLQFPSQQALQSAALYSQWWQFVVDGPRLILLLGCYLISFQPSESCTKQTLGGIEAA
ncbi:MAG: hypothetical protein AAGA30_18040, partial [Planctomycetota bacterium]